MQIGKIFLGLGRLGGLFLLLGSFGALAPAFAQQAGPSEQPKAEAPKDGPAAKPDSAAAPAEEGAIQTSEIASRIVIETHGSASWEEGYAKIGEALAKLRASAEKAGLKVDGRPLAVFTETDDAGFKFDALLPVDAKPDAKPDLGANFSLAQSPSGKALKFQHRGAYDDIDATYDAITAYLDEKGLEARNLFVEEYLNDAKDSSDVGLEVDIFVFLK
ncbi:GyrI-like domain-containing protein [uncultured Rhodoblastus sp.]|uniref:GyrI-like domain-containing protein n=1 Tax=uncultured Rhodoblastus sp. TaxID=543037 RepID=UPI0025E69A3B|nr:GyrI-like domain-containing protein [uncultured Rhodoblastus sp.]